MQRRTSYLFIYIIISYKAGRFITDTFVWQTNVSGRYTALLLHYLNSCYAINIDWDFFVWFQLYSVHLKRISLVFAEVTYLGCIVILARRNIGRHSDISTLTSLPFTNTSLCCFVHDSNEGFMKTIFF